MTLKVSSNLDDSVILYVLKTENSLKILKILLKTKKKIPEHSNKIPSGDTL